MTEALTPAAFDAEITSLIEALATLRAEYRDAYHTAWEAQVVESVAVSGGGRSARLDEEALTEQARAVLRDKGALRGKLRATSSSLRHATDVFKGRIGDIREAMAKVERPHGATFDPVMHERSAFRSDIEDARAAQARRRDRGEVLTGNDAEVRARLGIGDM